ncbi:MAG: hypothetical protein E6H73_16090, partial [Betaproteobacteria bacterium]
VFVREDRTLAVEDTKGGDTHPGAAANPASLFRIPIFATFPYMLTGIALGVAQGAYESVIDGLRGRVARYSGKSLADMTAVQIKIAEAGACIDTARRVMRDHCQTAQALAERGEVPDLLTKVTWRRDGAFTAGLCERAVNVLFKTGGGGALFDDHPLQRAFRDGAAGDDVWTRCARAALRQSDALASRHSPMYSLRIRSLLESSSREAPSYSILP